MDKKLRGTTNLCLEIMISKRQVMAETWSRGTNSRLPFNVNVMLNLSNLSILEILSPIFKPRSIGLFGYKLNVVPNSNLPGLRFCLYCICVIIK